MIIGVDDYNTLPKLPSVANTVNDLAVRLCDSDLWGLARPQHCKVLLNPPSPEIVLDTIYEAAGGAEDAFVVYFAGHGLVSPRGDLYLALPQSTAGQLYRAVAYEEVRRLLVEECTAPSKVVILDCCYSGRALVGHMGETAEFAAQASVEGTYLMTSSAETKLSWAPEGEKYTAFTGELLQALDEGVPDGPELLDMQTLFWHVRAELKSKSRPEPQQRSRNAGHNIALARNRRGRKPEAGSPVRQPPQSPTSVNHSRENEQSSLPDTSHPRRPEAEDTEVDDSQWIDVIDIREGQPDRRVLRDRLIDPADGEGASTFRSSRANPAPGLSGLILLPLGMAILVAEFTWEYLPTWWPASIMLWLTLTALFLAQFEKVHPNAVHIDSTALYVNRFENWIYFPWVTIESIYLVKGLQGTRLHLRLDPDIERDARVRIFLSGSPLLCPVGRLGFPKAELFTALRRYTPENILDPELRSPR
ncbi:caspase domain-containing protein [Streptomyces ehimensis]|uniref:caspase family protein n=1 Tax=Streptomyces ehimensis TaxID=68195 RepID=UPI003AABF1AE